MNPSRSPIAAVAPAVVFVADDVVGHRSVGELLAVVELVSLAVAIAVQHEVSGAVSRPEKRKRSGCVEIAIYRLAVFVR